MLARDSSSRAPHGSVGGRQAAPVTPLLNDDQEAVLNDDETPVFVGDA